MDADKESRSRQYDGTAMSDEEVSKVPEIMTFGIFDKSYIKKQAVPAPSSRAQFHIHPISRINFCVNSYIVKKVK